MFGEEGSSQRRWPGYLVGALVVGMSGKTTLTTDSAADELRLVRGDIQSIAVQVGVLGEKVRNLENQTDGNE